MLRACAFDLGNTLVDDSRLLVGSVARFAEWLVSAGHLRSRVTFVDAYMSANSSSHAPFISHTYGEPDFFRRAFDAAGVCAISADEALRVYRGFAEELTFVEEGVAAGLRLAHGAGMKLAIISNERVGRVNAFLHRCRLESLFDAVVVSEEVGVEKPQAPIFETALRCLDIAGRDCAMVGDNEIADGACKAVGMRFVLVTQYKKAGWGWEFGEAHQPDYIMERISPESMAELFRHAERSWN